MQSVRNSKQEFISLATKILRRIERAEPHEQWWHDVREHSHKLNSLRMELGAHAELNSNFSHPVFYVSDVWRDAEDSIANEPEGELLFGVREWFNSFPWIVHATTVTFSGCDKADEAFSVRVMFDATFNTEAHARAPGETRELFDAEHVFPNGIGKEPEAMVHVRRRIIQDLSNWIDAVQLATIPAPISSPQAPFPAEAKAFRKVTLHEIVKSLGDAGREISSQTLNNSYKKEWGEPQGKTSNAFYWNWDTVRPIIERQFGLKLQE